jgi:hypothetical protein
VRGWTFHLNFRSCLVRASLTGTISWQDGPPMPGPIVVHVTKEDLVAMGKMIFSLDLPPASAPDVVTQELTVSIPGADPQVFKLGADQKTVEGLKAERDAQVALSLVDVDGAGNRSPAREQTATIADTIAPPQPGEIAVRITGEEPDPPAAA